MLLTDLKPGGKARILDIMPVPELLRRRLIDLGVMEGTEVRLLRALPFGGPITVEAAGQWIGIRRGDAGRIRVEPA